MTQSCCTFPRGFKCSIIWALSLSCVGLVWSIICGSFWSWFTGIVAVSVIGSMTCVRQAKPLAVVGAVFSFLSFLLMAIASIVIGTAGVCLYGGSGDDFYGYYYDDYYYYYSDSNPCVVWSVMAGLGSLLWIPPGIICIKLACQLGAPEGGDEVAVRAVPVDVEKGGAPAEQPTPAKAFTIGAVQHNAEVTDSEPSDTQEAHDRTNRIGGTPGRSRIEETSSSNQSGGKKFAKVKMIPREEETETREVYVERD